MEIFGRTEFLLGKDNLNILKNSRVAVFGVGGVGGFVVESLVRSGVGNIDVFDNDVVSPSNFNRQIIADVDTVGKDKVEQICIRARKINKEVNIVGHKTFYLPENADNYDFSRYDYIVDAVDTVTAKLEIIKRAKEKNVKVISCMGTGGKLDPKKIKVSDIENTSYCPLARVVRRELNKLGIKGVKAVYSTEQPLIPKGYSDEKVKGDRNPPPSMIFVPACSGIIIANEVCLDLLNFKR